MTNSLTKIDFVLMKVCYSLTKIDFVLMQVCYSLTKIDFVLMKVCYSLTKIENFNSSATNGPISGPTLIDNPYNLLTRFQTICCIVLTNTTDV